MATSNSKVSLALALVVLVGSLVANVHGCVLTIRNNCPYPVTSCARSDAGATSRYQLNAGASQGLDFGSACKWPSAVVYASVGGTTNDTNLANLAEFNIGQSNLDYYDLSNVYAYTIGMQIIPDNGDCKALKCSIPNIPGFCQPTNILTSFPTGTYSCRNTDGQIGYATLNNQRFESACPDAYNYPSDDSAVGTCPTGTNYQVVLCP